MRTKLNDSRPKNLDGVAFRDRVWIYNADVILEFLNSTFMPTRYFIKDEYEMSVEKPDLHHHFKNPLTRNSYLPFNKVYEYYMLFRQQRPYTKEIESRFKFGVILKKMTLGKNGWLIEKKRVGRDQQIFVGPLVLRVSVDLEMRSKFPVNKMNLSESEIKFSPHDVEEVDE